MESCCSVKRFCCGLCSVELLCLCLVEAWLVIRMLSVFHVLLDICGLVLEKCQIPCLLNKQIIGVNVVSGSWNFFIYSGYEPPVTYMIWKFFDCKGSLTVDCFCCWTVFHICLFWSHSFPIDQSWTCCVVKFTLTCNQPCCLSPVIQCLVYAVIGIDPVNRLWSC